MAKSNVLEANGSTIELKEGTYTFQLVNKITPRIAGELPYPPKFQLASRVMAYDEETGEARKIRLIEGVKSYWMDEQKNISDAQAKSAEWIPEFVKGVLMLEYPQDAAKIKCLLARDEYDGKAIRYNKKPPVYTLVNKEQEYKSKVGFIEERHKAEGYAIKASDEDMLDHLAALNINRLDGLREKALAELREEYVQKAGSDPKLFLATYGNPLSKAISLVKDGLSKGIIDLTQVKGEARWSDSKAFIVAVNDSEETATQLAKFSMSKDGEPFYKTLSQKIKGAEAKNKK